MLVGQTPSPADDAQRGFATCHAHIEHIDAQTAADTVNILLKYRTDIAKVLKEFSTNAATTFVAK